MFQSLSKELLHWSKDGQIAAFWWRDDDAQTASASLDPLLEISRREVAALSLAVIPHGARTSLSNSISGLEQVYVLQHGFSHSDFAAAGERKMELGWHRSAVDISAQLGEGYEYLQGLFAGQFLPVMVPPWNRIDPQVVALLKDAGFKGLSTLGPRQNRDVISGIKEVNVHVDIINWKQGRCFAGQTSCEAQIVAHLSAKRKGRVDANEPTGIMSHHLVHDADCGRFLASLFAYLNDQPAATILDAKAVFCD